MIDHALKVRSPGESGSVLVLILILMVPLVGLSIALVSQGSFHLEERDAAHGRARALINAEAGIDQALAQLLATPTNLAPLTATYEESDNLRYVVTFADLGADGLDNDSDADVDEADEDGLVALDSRGSVNVVGYDAEDQPISAGSRSYVKRIRAVGRRLDGMPSFPYAVYLGDPNAETDFNGNAFLISGFDHDADGNQVAGDPVPGIACTGDPADIEDQISNPQNDNIIGEGGEPSVENTAPLDLQAIIDLYKNSADITFDNPSGTFTGSLGDPDARDFKITHCAGNLDISGGAEGAGMMLIEGNLEITGNFEYLGIVVVTGQVIFRGGGGVKRLIGTLLVGGDVIENFQNNTEDFEVSGTIDILYSSSVQEDVGEAFSDFTIISWQEF